MNVTKKDLVKSISKKCGYTQKQVKTITDEFIDEIAEELAKGNKVTFQGFGTFSTKERHERIGRNVTTGESILIPAKRIPAFKAGSKLKKMVEEGEECGI